MLAPSVPLGLIRSGGRLGRRRGIAACRLVAVAGVVRHGGSVTVAGGAVPVRRLAPVGVNVGCGPVGVKVGCGPVGVKVGLAPVRMAGSAAVPQADLASVPQADLGPSPGAGGASGDVTGGCGPLSQSARFDSNSHGGRSSAAAGSGAGLPSGGLSRCDGS